MLCTVSGHHYRQTPALAGFRSHKCLKVPAYAWVPLGGKNDQPLR